MSTRLQPADLAALDALDAAEVTATRDGSVSLTATTLAAARVAREKLALDLDQATLARPWEPKGHRPAGQIGAASLNHASDKDLPT